VRLHLGQLTFDLTLPPNISLLACPQLREGTLHRGLQHVLVEHVCYRMEDRLVEPVLLDLKPVATNGRAALVMRHAPIQFPAMPSVISRHRDHRSAADPTLGQTTQQILGNHLLPRWPSEKLAFCIPQVQALRLL
jgi:hypothetical protein